MTTVEDVLRVARAEIGTKENPPRSNRTKYGEWYSWNGVPWCAIFVSYCFYMAGNKLPPIQSKKGFAYCPYGVDFYRTKREFDRIPKAGDIVFFDWEKDGVSDHVGIVEKVLNNNQVVTIEGNTSYENNSNGGEVMRRTRDLSTIQGFAHPYYDGVSTIGSASSPTWSRYIMLTSPLMRGEDIREWQSQMISLGYDLGESGADGIFGPLSHKALLKFQGDRNLEVDGTIGLLTWNETWKKPA